ncbi:MAG TPA: superoxide dismutase [Tangfeifania sp.]|nr:superoxide dismutase [Tangfeifania sp.]
MAFILPELEFKYHALEPHIDAETMKIHYLQHHASYLKKFNEAIAGTELEKMQLEDIFANVSQYTDSVRNNGGGFFNHTLFWQILTPFSTEPENVHLRDTIIKYFGNFEHLRNEFSQEGMKLFGSGWVWLIKKQENELLITSTANQDNPLMDVASIRGKPLLCLDVWEHAYYLKYQNRRAEYIEAFWNLINWKKVAELFNNENINF